MENSYLSEVLILLVFINNSQKWLSQCSDKIGIIDFVFVKIEEQLSRQNVDIVSTCESRMQMCLNEC